MNASYFGNSQYFFFDSWRHLFKWARIHNSRSQTIRKTWFLCFLFFEWIKVKIMYVFVSNHLKHHICSMNFVITFLTRDSYYTRNWHVFQSIALTISLAMSNKRHKLQQSYDPWLLTHVFYTPDCQLNKRNFTTFSSPIS